MDGDFKRPLGTNNTGVPAPATTSGFEGSPETYENAEGAPVEAVKEPQEMKEKKPGKFKKFMLRFLLVLVIAGLAAAAGWFWYSNDQNLKSVADLDKRLYSAETAASRYKSALDEAQKTPTSKQIDKATLIEQFSLRQAVAVAVFKDTDKAALEKGIKDHFKISSLPSGYMTLVVYKDPKGDADGKPWHAVSYSSSSDKGAGVFEMVQQTDGSWKYDG